MTKKEEHADLSTLIDRKQRQANMNDILNGLDPGETEFNTMLLGFTDIMQSTFYNYMVSQAKTEKERDEMDVRINKTITEVMQVLNLKSISNPEDMVILTTIMIESIVKALVRQDAGGQRVSQKLHNIKRAAR